MQEQEQEQEALRNPASGLTIRRQSAPLSTFPSQVSAQRRFHLAQESGQAVLALLSVTFAKYDLAEKGN